MRRELRWTEQAASQLAAIAEYVGVASPLYAEQIVDRIVIRLQQVQEFPDSGRHVPESLAPNLRELIEVPYRVIYRATHEHIEVVAIVHGRRDLASGLSG